MLKPLVNQDYLVMVWEFNPLKCGIESSHIALDVYTRQGNSYHNFTIV